MCKMLLHVQGPLVELHTQFPFDCLICLRFYGHNVPDAGAYRGFAGGAANISLSGEKSHSNMKPGRVFEANSQLFKAGGAGEWVYVAACVCVVAVLPKMNDRYKLCFLEPGGGKGEVVEGRNLGSDVKVCHPDATFMC